MMTRLKELIFICTSVLMVGCASTEPKVDLSNKNFRSAPNVSVYQKEIEEKIKSQLKDPDSAKISKCIPPRKAYMFDGAIVGWATLCQVNAKNSFGGYTGNQIWAAFIAVGDKKPGYNLVKVESSDTKNRTIHLVE